jgi:hypothetical protein
MRAGWPDVPFVALALASGALLLYLGRSLTFWYDEWRSITFEGSGLDYLRPVNEHWSTFPLLLYRATFHLVELRSYLPYLAELIVLHVVAVSAAYVLMRRRLGPLYATLLSIPLLLLGAGAENLYWAFQTGFVGSVLFGLWALVLVDTDGRGRALVASALLVASLMSSGIGIVLVVAVSARMLVERQYRRCAVVAVSPTIAYLLWHVVYGRDAVGTAGDLAGPLAVLRFVVRGVGYAIEIMVGIDRLPTGRLIGFALFLALFALVLRRVLGGSTPGLAAGCLVGLAAMYGVIGVARAGLEFDYTTRGRYVYVGAFFIVLCVADLLAGRTVAFGTVPARRRLLAGGAAVAALAWIVAVNVNSLLTVRTQFQYQADLTRAIIELAVEHEGELSIDPEAGIDLMPPARELPRLVAEHGSPLDDAYFPSVVTLPSRTAYQDARRYLDRRKP